MTRAGNWQALAMTACLVVPALAQSDALLGATTLADGLFNFGQFIDLDGNGRLDFVTFSAGSMAIRYQQPDGTFEALMKIPETKFTYYIAYAVGDVLGSDLPDVVVTKGTNKLALVPTLSKGEFGAPIVTANTGTMSVLRLAFLDGDDQLDLIGLDPTTSEEAARIFVGNPDGTFIPASVIPFDDSASSPDAADLNGDGLADLVFVVDGLTNKLVACGGHGDGTFGAKVATTIIGDIGEYVLTDLDQDGLLDAIVSVVGSDELLRLKILRGTGQLTFTIKLNIELCSMAGDVVQFATAVAWADVDEDGLNDVVVGSLDYSGAPAGFWLLRGQGGFDFGAPEKFDTPGKGGSVVLADVDDSGHLDVVQSDVIYSSLVSVWPGDGTGHFDVPHFPAAPAKTREVAAADFDGDANPDILATLDDPGGLASWLGDGLGGLTSPFVATGLGPLDQLDVADLDGDGDLDAAASETSMEENVQVALNDGAAAFAPGVSVPVGALSDLALADIDGDADSDIVVSLPVISAIGIAPGDGHGAFGPVKLVSAGGASNGVCTADFDLDGAIDIATAVPSIDVVLVLSGASAFGSATVWPAGDKPQKLLAADLDQDGDIDLVTASAGVMLLRNLGQGTFDVPWDAKSEGPPRALGVSDVNRDGLMDVLCTASWSGNAFVEVLLGTPDGFLDDGHDFRCADGAQDLALSDFDHDGYMDVVTASGNSLEIGLLLNLSGTWATLGNSLGMPSATPLLQGTGEPVAGQSISLTTSGASTQAHGWLVVGLHATYAGYKGGVIVPSADLVLPYAPNSTISAIWPAGVAADTPIYLQAWFVAQGEVAASNALVVLAK